MDLRTVLLEEHSKARALLVASYVGSDPVRFSKLVKLLVDPVYRVSQRAAWSVSLCLERYPELVRPHFGLLIKQLEDTHSHVAVRRNVVRLFQFVEIPKRYEGRVFDACYNLLDDAKQPVAVRVFSMTVAAKLANGNRDLLEELRLVATKYPVLMTAGFRSRFRRMFGNI